MVIQNLKIRQGESAIFTETITGIVSLSGYTAKMYIVERDGTAIDELTGTINTLTVVYTLLNEDSKAYPIGRNYYETKLFDSSDHVHTPSGGAFIVETTIENDPI